MRHSRSMLLLASSAILLSCEHPSTVDLTPSADEDPTAAGAILGAMGVPFDISKAFRLLNKPVVTSVSISPQGLASPLPIGGDAGFVCERTGTGILWVYYSIYDDPFAEYYNLDCQAIAITPMVDDLFNVSAVFRQANGPTVVAISIDPPRLATPITADGKGPVVERRPEAMAPGAVSYGTTLSEQDADKGDISLLCKEVGEGMLHVEFAPESAVGSRAYALTCRRHDQGGGG
jgi:hypothetical protein